VDLQGGAFVLASPRGGGSAGGGMNISQRREDSC